MQIEELKLKIESKQNISLPLIFRYTENYFIANQYISQIAKDLNKQLQLVNDITDILQTNSSSIFDLDSSNELNVLICDTFTYDGNNLYKNDDLFIICKKINPETEENYKPIIVDIPKLESWQIQDYVYSVCEGVPTNNLDKLVSVCGSDIYRINQECKKLRIFSLNERPYIFDQFVNDNVFSDMSSKTIFDLSNAVMKRDRKALHEVLVDIEKIDVEPIGLQKILVDNFRDVIRLQLGKNVSPEVCLKDYGWNKGKYWAMKYQCGYYTRDELIDIFKFLTGLRFGDVPENELITYMLSHIINV